MNKAWMKSGLLLILCIALTACGAKADNAGGGSAPSTSASSEATEPTNGGPVEIEFWNILNADLSKSLVDAYNSSQNKVRVKSVFVQNSYEGIVEKLQVQAAAKKLPDVVTNGLLYTRFASETIHAVPLDTFIKQEKYDTSDFYPSMLNLGKNGHGQQIGFPFGISTPVLYYNADQFRDAGLNPDSPPQTWEELPEIAKKLTRNGHFGVNMAIDFGWLYQALMETYGGRMMSADGKSVGLDSEASIKAVQTIVDMVTKDKSMPLLQGTQPFESMAKGDIGMLVHTTAGLGMIAPTAKYDLRTAPFPTYQGKQVVPAGGSNLMIFTIDKAKQEAAWDFIKYLTDAKRSVQISTSTGYMVSRVSAYEDPDLQKFLEEKPYYKATYGQLETMVPWFNFPGTGGTRVQKIIADQIQAALQGQKSPEEAMKEAAKQANSLVQS
ncbi:ABC transporter substrate-binding protein [Cohnella herbarum]|uniref:Extracellular solute-binding protein n=1 Tax=Cohnella herbarum TaxID=2728023 RepID=A0A7Z2VMR1_9BACL|nr:ABC transporter substrate-binding protein [Cohnella herbarum]QJD86156.1 extracellular solute-binding protein [Cohnella herbarum]